MHKKLSWIPIAAIAVVGLLAVILVFGKFLHLFPESEESVRETITSADQVGASGFEDYVGVQDTTAPVVTPVSGPSWIKHLGISNTTSTAMGRMGEDMPAPPSQREEPSLGTEETPSRRPMGMRGMMNRIFSVFRGDNQQVANLMNETFVLAGSDLYRLNCQSCHGPDGTGSPPEIKSLLDPIRGASPALIMKRMQEMDRPIDMSFAKALAANADSTLRARLQNGGEKMPPFQHLRGDEVDALMEYLKRMAGVPQSERKEMLVTQSVARVGEHVVKGTCHICHDATGPGGGHMAMMRGIIPSLASSPREKSAPEVVRQVEMGSSSMMSMMGGEKMPAFPYITENEAIAAYLYLVEYPPRP